MRESVKLAREIFSQPAFDEYRADELEPGSEVDTDEAIDNFVRQKSDSSYHPSCTCKMGDISNDPKAVVDAETMRVAGVEGLYVVDASTMPQVASGNLNAPTIMIAEKAADILKGQTPLQAKVVPVYKPETLETRR